jgi:surfeit locus 1 family protein
MRIRFRFRWIPFIATVAMVALGLSLGQWQDRRAAQKTALGARLAERHTVAPVALGAAPAGAELEFRHVAATGQFVREWPLYLENRPYRGRAGFYLMMPFKIAGSDTHVLVARGWLARNGRDRTRLPAYPTPSGTVTIAGTVKLNLGHVMQLGSPPPLRPGAIVQNVELDQFARASGLKLQPFVIEQAQAAAPDPGDPLVRDWPAPSLGIDKHRGYAFQWYALALMALLFFVITGCRRGTK